MIEELSMTQIAARIGISERTAQRWIAAGRLKVIVLHNHRYAVESADILALQIPDHLGHELAERLERLEQQVAELRTELEALKQERRPPIRATPQPSQEIQHTHAGDTLPPELVSAQDFSARHGIAASTTRKAIHSGRLPVVTGRWKLGRAWITEALSQEGRLIFVMQYRGNPNFTRCDDPACPCHGV